MADPAPSESTGTASLPTSRWTLPLYLIASATSLFGNAAINIVLPWLVLERTGDPALAGTVAAVSAVPSAIAALVGGHLIDRFGRRRMSVISDIGSAVSVAGLAVVDHLTGLDLTWFIVLGIAGALFDLPGMTARETLLANVARASGKELDLIAGWRQTIFGVSFLAGPAIAGVLLNVFDTIEVVWLTAACSGLAALSIAVMPLVPMPVEPAESSSENPLGAVATVRKSPPLVWLIALSVWSSVLVTPLLAVVLPAHFQQSGHPDQLGLSLSAYAVGTILGGGLYAALLKKARSATWVLSMVLFSASFFLIAFLHGFWLVAAGMVIAGVAQGLQGPIVTVLMTTHIPDRLRGRIFGMLTSLNALAAPVGLGIMSVILAAGTLSAGAWFLAVAWAPMAVLACVAPGLRAWLTAPVHDADDR